MCLAQNNDVVQALVNLAGLFRIRPIAGIKNCYTYLQEGKVICMGNRETKIDQLERSFP
jgi:hypothetical protein